jgi:AraC family transcriptional regulator
MSSDRSQKAIQRRTGRDGLNKARADIMGQVSSTGHVVIWPGRALYIGELLEHQAHAHHAVQVSVALDGALYLQASPESRWVRHRAAVTAPDRAHRLRCSGRIAQIYLDPESTTGVALRQQAGASGVTSLQDVDVDALAAALRSTSEDPSGPGDLVQVVDRMLPAACLDFACRTMDPRVQKTLNAVQALSGHPVSLATMARRVGLSPSRLGKLFRRDVGIPFRRYLLWLRLVNAVEALSDRATLTEAAHRAGFSDSAHFSRTFRRMFGMPPSQLVTRNVAVYDFAAGSPAAPWWTSIVRTHRSHNQVRATK